MSDCKFVVADARDSKKLLVADTETEEIIRWTEENGEATVFEGDHDQIYAKVKAIFGAENPPVIYVPAEMRPPVKKVIRVHYEDTYVVMNDFDREKFLIADLRTKGFVRWTRELKGATVFKGELEALREEVNAMFGADTPTVTLMPVDLEYGVPLLRAEKGHVQVQDITPQIDGDTLEFILGTYRREFEQLDRVVESVTRKFDDGKMRAATFLSFTEFVSKRRDELRDLVDALYERPRG